VKHLFGLIRLEAFVILKSSFDAVRRATYRDVFLKPLYGSYCFSGLPTLIQNNFGVENCLSEIPLDVLPGGSLGFEKVVMVLVDGLGWRFFDEGLSSHPLFHRFQSEGVVAKLTSMFPSTTVAHVVAMATGMLPAQTGILEWYQYEPVFGDVICPLLYNFAGDKSRRKLSEWNSEIHAVFPNASLSCALASVGVRSHIYQPKAHVSSVFSKATSGVASLVPYTNAQECFDALSERMKIPGKAYHFLYLDALDAQCHESGPSSRKSMAEANNILSLLEGRLFGREASRWRDTLVIVTADHGLVDTNLQSVVYVNEVWPGLSKLLKRAPRTGLPIAPCGGMGRNLFLHVEPQCIGEVRETLTQLLRQKAVVASVFDLLEDGIFGTNIPSKSFFERAGSLVVLPHAHESVWWLEEGKHRVEARGNHGGLSRQEMEIPFFSCAFD
jgi:hypothetical protein